MKTPKQLREDAGLRQVDAASGAKVALSTVQAVEAGRSGSMTTLAALAELYGVSVGDMAESFNAARREYDASLAGKANADG